ncbi:hypothetical protein Nepgr_006770 [Nepenthes gracilis]|uniref:Uncharacterized protein n=1 Tax=Nepenthes gracilis TaxID=150966 RepID=A0AAD3S5R3_NEPGR|nr:hypothetical protein Nepgr_006770 [Nepenthes gracilis]
MLECGRLSNCCAAEFVAGVLILYFCEAERLKMLDHSVCLATVAVYAVFPALDPAVVVVLWCCNGWSSTTCIMVFLLPYKPLNMLNHDCCAEVWKMLCWCWTMGAKP